MADYTKGRNIGRKQVTDDVRVSTAYFPPSDHGYDGRCIETWVFSDRPGFPSRQYFHHTERAAHRRHPMIVKAVRTELKKQGQLA